MFYFFVTSVMLLTIFIPRIITSQTQKGNNLYLYIAALLFVGSFLLPDIEIDPETKTFQQHFVGGGLYVAFLYEYFRPAFFRTKTGLLDFYYIFAMVSALGVANELFEFAVDKLGISYIYLGDTSWDLLANSLGAIFGYIMFRLIKKD